MGHDGGSVSYDAVLAVEFGVLVGASGNLDRDQAFGQKSSAAPGVVEGFPQVGWLLVKDLVVPLGAVDGVDS